MKPDQKHAAEVAALMSAVHTSNAATDLAPLPAKFIAMVRDQSYKITDRHIKELLDAGYTQDAVFEMTVIASVDAALHGLRIGLNLIREDH